MKNYAATTVVYPKGDNRKMLHRSKIRGTTQHNASTHGSLSCADNRTTTAASSRKKEHLSVLIVPLYIRVSYCRCCRCICVGYEWYVTGTMVHTWTRRARANIEKCNNRLDVDMNTEPVFIIPDEVVHYVKNQATKVRRDHSFRWIQPRCWAWPWPTHQTARLHNGDDAATLRYCSYAGPLLLYWYCCCCCMIRTGYVNRTSYHTVTYPCPWI